MTLAHSAILQAQSNKKMDPDPLSDNFDVTIVGGGISGLGAALACCETGYKTLLLEKGHICGETSNNSLRIIHGGFRYLQSLNFVRVIESLKEQNRILREAPSLVKRLPCILPLTKFGLKSRIPASVATNIYNALSKNIVGQSNKSQCVSANFIDKYIPVLAGQAPHGALLWHDALLRDPLKLGALIKHRIERAGGEVIEEARVSEINRSESGFNIYYGTCAGRLSVRTKAVVNTTGPWLNRVVVNGVPRRAPTVAWCRAFNVVLNRSLEERFAIGSTASSGQVVFAVPRGQKTAIGTRYLPSSLESTDPGIAESEVAEFLTEINSAFPKAKINITDVESVESGVLPINPKGTGRIDRQLIGRSRISSSEGFIDVLSTKYTTFHSQGERVVKELKKFLG